MCSCPLKPVVACKNEQQINKYLIKKNKYNSTFDKGKKWWPCPRWHPYISIPMELSGTLFNQDCGVPRPMVLATPLEIDRESKIT